MGNAIEWYEENRIKITPPKNPLKLTGTRFAAVLGANVWSTPFKVWCEVTRTYKEPFEDTIYTIAGKAIEPKQAEYIRQEYFWKHIVTPTDCFGEDYFDKTKGDFFPDVKTLGGMWDYIFTDKDGNPTTVLEMKTTKRAEDWADGIPEYYALQAALYAYLLGVDDVIMVASFLDEKDYSDPDAFVCTPKNTIIIPFKLSVRYPNFETEYVKPVLDWWAKYVLNGISPAYDETKDADILKALRTNNLSPETDLADLLTEADELKQKIDAHSAEIAEAEKRYDTLTKMIKSLLVKQFRNGDTKVSSSSEHYIWEVSCSTSTVLDTDAMKTDGVYDKYYTKTSTTYKLTPKKPKVKK